MDFSKEIIDLVSGQTGGIVITDEVVGEIVYADHFFTEQTGKSPVGENAEETLMYLQDCPELVPDAPAQEWEALDIMNKQYYKINSRMFTKEGKLYRIHQLTNITEYIGYCQVYVLFQGVVRFSDGNTGESFKLISGASADSNGLFQDRKGLLSDTERCIY